MKITGGIFKGRELKSVPDRRTRYTTSLVRQAIFSMIEVAGASFLELFCGSAVVSLEALSRGANFAVAVDISRKAVKTASENSKLLQANLKIVNADFERFLKASDESFDFVFADPPYDLGFVQRLLDLLSERPEIGKIIIVEKAVAEGFVLPVTFTLAKTKRYGDTEIVLLERNLGPRE
ncbi:16S rRNA (guanine(966)-N(2))-methyltransferase RsmD [Pseudothermotoga sp. U03pept]|uniref:16S rRNA (guanine(966)-N(2))-methyltransferase RsmD n=1 Tax=Pseudothermotoga sp. U03pept TaxID=3447012 RepID=UPI003F0DBB6C